jgi:hypothetical protein
MNESRAICWICRERHADSGEHRLKASDIRSRLPALSQQKPIFLQSDSEATNTPVGSAKSRNLKFADSICRQCNNVGTSRYDEAWRMLSEYLHGAWPEIRRADQFDLSAPFGQETGAQLVRLHLYFVKIFGCKLLEDSVPFDLHSLAEALVNGRPHPDIGLNFADSPFADGEAIAYQSDVNTMGNGCGELHGLIWLYLIHPVAVKVSYIKSGAPLYVPGDRWHPLSGKTMIRLSPFKGGTEPIDGLAALLPDH